MLHRRRDRRHPKAYESLLLTRIMSVLVGYRVNLHCKGGTIISGTVESCGGDLRNVPLGTALQELEHCKRTSQHEPSESQRASLEAVSRVKFPSGTGKKFRISSEPSRIYLLRGCTVNFKSRTFSVEKMGVRQEYISTLCNDNDTVTESSSKKFASAHHLKRAILQAHRDLVKNHAFDRCARIGSNNND